MNLQRRHMVLLNDKDYCLIFLHIYLVFIIFLLIGFQLGVNLGQLLKQGYNTPSKLNYPL